ncbi:MAG: DNA helicase RecG, partial [Actinobacteria bacterium]|nr:DNA helicase RecG [Actinomycetota bacterium]
MARRLSQLAQRPVTALEGVGPERAKALAHFDLHTILDLITHYPRRYLDRTREARIEDLVVGDEAMVIARVQRANVRRTRTGKALVTVDVADGSGHLRISFFNQQWRERQLRPGTDAVFFGKLDVYQGRRQMTNPVVDLIGDKTGKIVPVYPQSEKVRLTSWDISGWMAESLQRAGEMVEPLPGWLLDRHDMVDRTAAFKGIHLPESMGEKEEARRRLVFDELLRIQLALVLRKRRIEATSTGIAHAVGGRLVARFYEDLPFELTGDQRTVIAEIETDLARTVPMHRLLQGDVGAGKTVVAVAALLTAVQG